MQTNTTAGLLPARIPSLAASNLTEVDRFVPDDFREKRAAAKLARSRRINAEAHDRRVMLKIKLIDLANEAKAIRREERLRIGGWLRTELRAHRVSHVRWEARLTHLAYGFLRGKTRASMERAPIAAISVELRKRVRALATKYGPAGATIPDAWFLE